MTLVFRLVDYSHINEAIVVPLDAEIVDHDVFNAIVVAQH